MELGNDPIIGFRTRGNATAVDYRGEMALKANEISALRAMSAKVEDTEEFNVVLASLIRMIFRVGCHEWCSCPGVTVTIFKKRFFLCSDWSYLFSSLMRSILLLAASSSGPPS